MTTLSAAKKERVAASRARALEFNLEEKRRASLDPPSSSSLPSTKHGGAYAAYTPSRANNVNLPKTKKAQVAESHARAQDWYKQQHGRPDDYDFADHTEDSNIRDKEKKKNRAVVAKKEEQSSFLFYLKIAAVVFFVLRYFG